MGKPNKKDKRKAGRKARKRQKSVNCQALTDRLSTALEVLCAPIMPEYVDDREGVDIIARRIVYHFGVIAWNLAVTGRKIEEGVQLRDVKLSEEEQTVFRNEIIGLVKRKQTEFPNFNTTIANCTVAVVDGVPRVKARPGITIPAIFKPLKAEPAVPPTPERIREIRRSLEFTQTKLGERLGVSASTVSAWERGKCKPQPALEKKIRELAAEIN